LRSISDSLPEVVLVPPGDATAAKRASRLLAAERLRRLYSGVFSSNLRAEDAVAKAKKPLAPKNPLKRRSK